MKYRENWIKPIAKLDPCKDALIWAKDFDNLDDAWQACERGDWMLWLLGKLAGSPKSKSRKKLVLAACQCARLALPHIQKGELRPLKAIETAEAWSRGERGVVTLEEVRKAAYAATSAASAAASAAYATSATTRKTTLKECADIVRDFYPSVPKILKEIK